MHRMSGVGRAFASGGFIAGVFAVLSILTKAGGGLEAFKEFHQAFESYARYIRAPVGRALGLESIPIGMYVLDALILWIGLFLAINAFVQRYDGLFLWGHIGRGYCYRQKQTALSQARCIIPKLVFAFLATPWVCVVAVWASIVRGQSAVTMAYMTVEPTPVARYLSTLFGIPAAILAIASLFF